MPRNRRLDIPGCIYHVITRGIDRGELFKHDTDRKEFLRRLEEGIKHTSCKCYGWALMSNHFHLIIRTGNKPLTDLMRRLLTGYAIYFNHKYKRSGYLYQNRYKSILCSEDSYLLELVRYIHLNPMRAGAVTDMKALAKYSWSGHSTLMGIISRPWQSTDEILEHFGRRRNEARQKYEMFVQDGKDMGRRDDLTGGGLRRSAGGWHGVYALKRAKQYWRSDERVLGDSEFVESVLKLSDEQMVRHERLKREGWGIDKLVQYVCNIFSVSRENIFNRSRKNNISIARELVMYWAKTELNISGRELAKYFNISSPAVTKNVRCGEKYVKEKNIKLIS